jgi:D-inositol-3-phosphate glycosyltransferase|tara:strand:- start:1513 stop:2646 length:1134 start_codon:yes stop_codon:yes gene_type:complete
MNILQISFHTAPFSSIGKFDSGGLNVYVQQVCHHLSINHNLTIITAEKAENFKLDNINFLSLNLFDSGLGTEDKEKYLQEFIEKLNENYDLKSFDVIHAHYWLSGLVAKHISNEFNIPFVFTAHSLGVFLDGYNKERVDCEKLIMTSSNYITASSNFEQNLISESYQIDKNKIKKITPGIDRSLFAPDLSTKRKNIFLSIGRIQQQKGQRVTIDFLNNFRKVENDFVCYFIGGPSGNSGKEYLVELKEQVVELNLETHVKFLENLPQTKIKELLNKSKLLIHTSQFETFGLVAIEANSMGVPVLSTNSGSFPEIIFSGVNGYLADNLVDGNVNNYVRDLLRDNKTFEETMFNCIEKSINYDWKITAREIEEIYRIIV